VGLAAHRRQRAADRRAIDAGEGLQDEAGDRHQRAGVAGGHGSLGLALLDEIDRHAHRRILLVAHGERRRLVHANDFGGTLDAQTLAELGERRPQVRLDGLRATDQHDAGIAIGAENAGRPERSPKGRDRPHAVNGQGDSHSART
jgi:hypothetical protein